MENIEHKQVEVKGLKLHVAEIGSVANKGYRAIDFDFRGYGLSDQLAEPELATFQDLIDDGVGLLDSLAINKGERKQILGGRFDAKTVIRDIYTLFWRSEVPVAGENQEIMDLFDPSTPLPPWFSEQDLSAYASLYEKSGFRYGLQVPYRTLSVYIGITDPKVTAPALLIMGEKDYCLNFPGMEEYIKSGTVKHLVPDLDITFLEEGSHFVHEQLPEKVNDLIITLIYKHSV
ncbi:Alpha/Beta hydrolase fold containing protein [Parasponia andersonii]|uniref:Alpha/Beta hydrolase fold containing protein n=1 Tax=Parasponia andersonii TaxID=3476 RepID=A0A2P5B4G2_PARAD|nr:Alpha/Beta hydrolase fold containing protein [Parasponia andersonii]